MALRQFTSFYQLIFQMNNKLFVSLPFVFLIEILSSLQIIHLILETMTYSNSNAQYFARSLVSMTPYFTGAFQLQAFSKHDNIFHSLWFIFMIYLSAFLCALICTLTHIIRKKNVGKRFLKVFAVVNLLHSRLLFFPIQYFFYNIVKLSGESSTLDQRFYNKASWIRGTIALIAINNLLAVLKELVFYQVNKTKNFTDSKTNLYHIIIIIYKSITLFLAYEGQLDNKGAVHANAILHFLNAIIILGILYSKLPFYNFRVMKMMIINSSIVLCLSFLSVIVTFTTNAKVLNGLQILIILLPPLAIKINLSLLKRLYERIIKGNYKSPEHAIHFALLIEEFVSAEDSDPSHEKTYIIDPKVFYGIFNSGMDFEKLKETNNDKKFLSQLYSDVLVEISNTVNKHSCSQLLLIFMAEFYLERLENAPKALELIRKIENSYLSPSMRSSVDHFYLKLEETYRKENFTSETQIELYQYFKTYDVMNNLKKNMLQEATKHLEFWNNIQKQKLNAKTIFDISQEIDVLFSRIQKTFQDNLSSFTNNLTSSILLYGVYLNNVRQLPSEASKVLNDFQKLNSTKTELEIVSGNTAVVIISLDKVKAGQILDASGSIECLFHLKKSELIGKNIGFLFPSIIGKEYQRLIQQYSKFPTGTFNLHEKTYGKSTKGDIFELEAQFQLNPYLNKEITVVLLLKKVSDSLPLMITNHDGNITDRSKSLQLLLQNESVNIKMIKSVQSLISNFEEANNAINQIYGPKENNSNQIMESVVYGNTTKFDQTTEFDLTSRALIRIEDGMTDRSRKFDPQITVEPFTDRSQVIPSKLELSEKRALDLCERLIKGKRVFLHTDKSFPYLKKEKLRAKIQVIPRRIGYEVYKIIRMTNIRKDNSSPIESKEEIQSEDDNSLQTFADDFPEINEKTVNEIFTKKRQIDKPQKNTIVYPFKEQVKEKLSMSFNELEEFENDDVQAKMDQEDRGSTTMNSFQQESLIISTLRRLTTRNKLLPTLYWLRITLAVLVLFLITLSVAKLVSSNQSIRRIEKGVQIVDVATLRFQAAVNTWFWSLVIASGSFPLEILLPTLSNEIHKLAHYNNELQRKFAEVGEIKTIERIYEKYLRVWTVKSDGEFFMDRMDSFTATDYLVGKYLPLTKMTDLSQLSTFTDLPSTFNNTANDYFIVAETLISETIKYLPIVVSRSFTSLRVILCLHLAFITILILFFGLVAVDLAKGYQRLCRALINYQGEFISSHISLLQKTKVLLESDIERKTFIEESYSLFFDRKKEEVKKTVKARNKAFDMKTMNSYLAKIIFSAIFLLLGFVIFYIVTTIGTNNTLDSLRSFTNDVSLLSKGVQLSNAIMGNLVYEALYGNIPKMFIRYQRPFSRVLQTIEEFRNLNQKLSSMFLTDSSITVDPLIEDVLQRDVCRYVSIEGVQQVCIIGTGNQRMGLLQVNTVYNDLLDSMIDIPNQTLNLVQMTEIFIIKPQVITGLMSTLENIYPVLITHVLNKLEKKTNNAEKSQFYFCLGSCLTIVVWMIFVFKKPIKTLKTIDLGRRKILKVLPYQMFQGNGALKYYLIRNFKKEIGNVKNLL